jgi:hypothetical protein
VVALCLNIVPTIASGSVFVGSCGRYIFFSLFSLALWIGEMTRSSRAWISTESKKVG